MRLVSEQFESKSRSPVERLRRQFERPQYVNMRSAVQFVLENGHGLIDERRRKPRQPLRVDATLSTGKAGGPVSNFEIFLKDVNAQFAGFISVEPIERGTRGSVSVKGNRGETLELSGTVGRCRQHADGLFHGFIAFDEPGNPFDRAA